MRKALLWMSVALSITLSGCLSDEPSESSAESKTLAGWEGEATSQNENLGGWEGGAGEAVPEGGWDGEGASAPATDVKERWCNSFPESHCPKNVCVWQADPAPGKCTLPSLQVE